jgi:hypothetical protein
MFRTTEEAQDEVSSECSRVKISYTCIVTPHTDTIMLLSNLLTKRAATIIHLRLEHLPGAMLDHDESRTPARGN